MVKCHGEGDLLGCEFQDMLDLSVSDLQRRRAEVPVEMKPVPREQNSSEQHVAQTDVVPLVRSSFGSLYILHFVNSF